MNNTMVTRAVPSRGHGSESFRPRYPMAPLLAVASAMFHRDVSVEEIGDALGLARRTVYRRLNDGLLEAEADAAACHFLKMHPWFVWPEWFQALEEGDEFALSA